MEEKIKEEIKDWSAKILEVPSSEFGGLAPCPYAKQAWSKDKVRFKVIHNLNECSDIKTNCPDDDSVDVVAWLGYQNTPVDEFDNWIDEQNDNHNGIWTIGFHPDHPEDESLEEYEGNGAPEYGLILIQSLAHLAKSSEAIFKKGYYDKYSKQDIDHIKERNLRK